MCPPPPPRRGRTSPRQNKAPFCGCARRAFRSQDRTRNRHTCARAPRRRGGKCRGASRSRSASGQTRPSRGRAPRQRAGSRPPRQKAGSGDGAPRGPVRPPAAEPQPDGERRSASRGGAEGAICVFPRRSFFFHGRWSPGIVFLLFHTMVVISASSLCVVSTRVYCTETSSSLSSSTA